MKLKIECAVWSWDGEYTEESHGLDYLYIITTEKETSFKTRHNIEKYCSGEVPHITKKRELVYETIFD